MDTNNRDTTLYELVEKRLNRRSPREVEESSFISSAKFIEFTNFLKKKQKKNWKRIDLL